MVLLLKRKPVLRALNHRGDIQLRAWSVTHLITDLGETEPYVATEPPADFQHACHMWNSGAFILHIHMLYSLLLDICL